MWRQVLQPKPSPLDPGLLPMWTRLPAARLLLCPALPIALPFLGCQPASGESARLGDSGPASSAPDWLRQPSPKPDRGTDDPLSGAQTGPSDVPFDQSLALYDFSGPVAEGLIDQWEAFTSDPGCVSPMSDCRDDYMEFPQRAAEFADPVSEEDLQAWIDESFAEPRLQDPVPASEFAAVVVDALGIRFLLDGIEQRPLEVRVFDDTIDQGFHTLRLLFTDPWVGSFSGRLVLPEGDGPFPVILAMHGHGTEDVDWIDSWGAGDYIEAGFAMLAVNHRMMYADQGETDVGHALAREGFTLLGLHVYETLRAMQYLRWRDDLVRRDQVILMGHSAGGNKTNLMVRITGSFAAAVSDNTTSILPEHEQYFHEAFVPELAPWQDLVNDLSTALVPARRYGYGFPEGTAPVLTFMQEALASNAR